MTNSVFTATINANGEPSLGMGGAVASTAKLVTDMATLSAAIAVLVADGALPTQAHVTTANNALTLVNADLTALTTANGNADISLTINPTNVVSNNNLLIAVRKMLHNIVNGTNLLS